MRYIVSASLILVGLIHFAPLIGVLGADRLEALYGLSIEDPNLLILMRHRAVLFGMLGAFIIAAAFRRSWEIGAFTAGFVSLVSFLGLVVTTEGYNAAITKVVAIDVMALTFLTIGVVVRAYLPPERSSQG